jgi:hypothetical protein
MGEYNSTNETGGELINQLAPADLKPGDVFIVPEVYHCPFALSQRGVRVIIWQLAAARNQPHPVQMDDASGRGCAAVGHSVYTAEWLGVPVGVGARQDREDGMTDAIQAAVQGAQSAAVWRPYISPSTSDAAAAAEADGMASRKEDLVIVDGDVIWPAISNTTDAGTENVWSKIRARGRLPKLQVAVASGKSHEEMQSLFQRAKVCLDLQMRTFPFFCLVTVHMPH